MIQARRVVAFTEEGLILGKYNSIKEAAKVLYRGNSSAQNRITNLCNGSRKTLLEHPTFGLLKFIYNESNN